MWVKKKTLRNKSIFYPLGYIHHIFSNQNLIYYNIEPYHAIYCCIHDISHSILGPNPTPVKAQTKNFCLGKSSKIVLSLKMSGTIIHESIAVWTIPLKNGIALTIRANFMGC